MTPDQIEIMHVEFDNETTSESNAIRALHYAEWRRNCGEVESAFARPHKASRNEGDDHLVPDDVRVAIAMLAAPGLVEAKR